MDTQNKTGNLIGLAISVGLTAVFSSILIWIVGLIGIGLQVDGFGPALIAGITIALVGGVVTWLLMALDFRIGNELLRAAINIVLGALVLLVCGQILPGLKVNGIAGALLASIAIGVIAWLLSLVPRRINRAYGEASKGQAQSRQMQ